MDRDSCLDASPQLIGTGNQIEWAERIRRRVNEEFDRVGATFYAVSARQDAAAKADTVDIIAILEDKRTEVMRREQAGYFIHDWQEITDQVRQMIFHDERYSAIRKRQDLRRSHPPLSEHESN
jgi:hypothetical protein